MKLCRKRECIWNDHSSKSICAQSKMSFQHFRLGELSLHQPLPADQGTISTQHSSFYTLIFSTAVPPTLSSSKQPYGSGDSDDGYTLIFQNLDAFQTWRATEEERQCVEFVKVVFCFPLPACLPSSSHLHPARAILMEARQILRDSRIIQSLFVLGTPAADVKNISKNIQRGFVRFLVERWSSSFSISVPYSLVVSSSLKARDAKHQ